MLLQLLLSPKNTGSLDDSSGDKSGTSIHLPAGAKDSWGDQRTADCLAYVRLCNKYLRRRETSWYLDYIYKWIARVVFFTVCWLKEINCYLWHKLYIRGKVYEVSWSNSWTTSNHRETESDQPGHQSTCWHLDTRVLSIYYYIITWVLSIHYFKFICLKNSNRQPINYNMMVEGLRSLSPSLAPNFCNLHWIHKHKYNTNCIV